MSSELDRTTLDDILANEAKKRNIDEYQRRAHVTGETYLYSSSIMYFIYPLLGIVGEAGEFVDKIKKICRNFGEPETKAGFQKILNEHPELKEAIQLELGDIDWYLAEFHTRLDILRSDTTQKNINKIMDRRARGVLRSEGDNR